MNSSTNYTFGTISWAVKTSKRLAKYDKITCSDFAKFGMNKTYLVKTTEQMNELGFIDNPFDKSGKLIIWCLRKDFGKLSFEPLR